MLKLLFMLCLGCTDYGTVDQKLRYQQKVYDTLVVVDEYNAQKEYLRETYPEPLPRHDDTDWEKVLPFPYPGKEGNDGGMIDPDIYRLRD